MPSIVSQLWHRIGTVRAVSALALIAVLVGGVVFLQTRGEEKTPVRTADAAALPRAAASTPSPSEQATPAAQATQATAQSKAQDAASAAAAQAKAAEDAARKKKDEEASRATMRTMGPPTYAIPAACDPYKAKSDNKWRGCGLMTIAGFGIDQMSCLEKLWDKESHWNQKARNASSGAYGIAQAVPPEKMGKIASDWAWNADTQIRWGLSYIKGRYSNPCGAWGQSQRAGWY